MDLEKRNFQTIKINDPKQNLKEGELLTIVSFINEHKCTEKITVLIVRNKENKDFIFKISYDALQESTGRHLTSIHWFVSWHRGVDEAKGPPGGVIPLDPSKEEKKEEPIWIIDRNLQGRYIIGWDIEFHDIIQKNDYLYDTGKPYYKPISIRPHKYIPQIFKI